MALPFSQLFSLALGGHEDLIQSFTWKGDGSLVASSCKDKKLRLFDPRAGTAAQVGRKLNFLCGRHLNLQHCLKK